MEYDVHSPWGARITWVEAALRCGCARLCGWAEYDDSQVMRHAGSRSQKESWAILGGSQKRPQAILDGSQHVTALSSEDW